MGRGSFHFSAALSHRDTEAGLFEHRDVVRHVANRGDFAGFDSEHFRQGESDGALVCLRMRNIDVVRLRTRGENRSRLIALRRGLLAKDPGRELADDVRFASRDRIQVVADPHDLHDFVHLTGEIRNNGGRKFDRPFLAIDVRPVAFTNKPIVAAVDPGVELVRRDDRENRFNRMSRQDVLFEQGKVRPDKPPAIECGQRSSETERPAEHLHSARRTAARDREGNARARQSLHVRDRPRGQHFLVRNQRAVDIGQDQLDRTHAPIYSKDWFLPLPTGTN